MFNFDKSIYDKNQKQQTRNNRFLKIDHAARRPPLTDTSRDDFFLLLRRVCLKMLNL
jgi:hypothetical protein